MAPPQINISYDPLQTRRSQYAPSKTERYKSLANRFVYSQVYIILYLSLAALSLVTVVLSLLDDCPGLAFFVCELIVNCAMVAEVGVRLFAFGKQFWRSPFNTVDVILTLLCLLTLLVLFFSSCSARSKEEEILDTLLLVARNVVQFVRLAVVIRNSGHSVFARIPAIDLASARAYALDFDLEDEEALIASRMAAGGDRGAQARGFLGSESDED